MIINIIPMPPAEKEDMTFSDFNQCDDRARWRGAACTDRLPGGGNTPDEHSKENNG